MTQNLFSITKLMCSNFVANESEIILYENIRDDDLLSAQDFTFRWAEGKPRASFWARRSCYTQI